MITLPQKAQRRVITGTVLGLCLIGLYASAPVWALSWALGAILAFILILEWPQFNAWWLTPMYPVAPFALLIMLNQSATRALLPVLFIAVFSHDTGAYIAGKLWGKHKLCPRISPGKTWEGFVGGIILSIGITYLFCIAQHWPTRLIDVTLLCIVLNIASTVGDLFESYLKRRASLKDAGNTLPGHGGWLDRFDGILGAVIVMYPLRALWAWLIGL